MWKDGGWCFDWLVGMLSCLIADVHSVSELEAVSPPSSRSHYLEMKTFRYKKHKTERI